MEQKIDGTLPIVIGATGIDEIAQNIRMIVLTTAYQVPLDRGFAHSGAFLDSPSPVITARLVNRLAEAIEEKEPRVLVDSIEMAPSEAQAGRWSPVITWHLKERA